MAFSKLHYALFVASAILLLVQCNAKSASIPTARNLKVEIGGEEFFFGTDPISWFDAESECEAQGLRLSTLDTEERYTLITDYISENQDFDISLWTSGHRDPNGASWHWESNHEDFVYTAWVDSFPSQPADQEACMYFSVSGGGWKDDACDFEAGYLCESIPA